MPINLISCVTKIKNKLAIGKNDGLIFRLDQDIQAFKNITSETLSDNPFVKNFVLMGRKTYFSIPSGYRPLVNRYNFVLTKDIELIKMTPLPKNLAFNENYGPYFISLDTFLKMYFSFNPNVFVIGGGDIYNYFLETTEPRLIPSKLYITEVSGYKMENNCSYTYMNNFDSKYHLVGYSQRHTGPNSITYRILYYTYTDKLSEEYKYLDLARKILENGKTRPDRTGVGTIGLFGEQLRFDISNGIIPLQTTKYVPFKSIIEELLWMMTGCTDSKLLQSKGVHIWDGNTSREFLDKQDLHHYDEGILGAGYGWQIRHQGAAYSQSFADTYNVDHSKIGGFDQLKYIENLLRTDPFSRRIMMSYWNPSDFKKTALLPCHYSVQFYVEEQNGTKHLSCLFSQRSSDELARSWNVVFYTVLTHILALRTGMKPKEIIFNIADAHIYKNHITQVETYINRSPRPFPKLKLNSKLANKDWHNMTSDDFELIGYFPHSSIKMKMAV